MSELIAMAGSTSAGRTFRGRRGPADPDDNLLFALLSHQPLDRAALDLGVRAGHLRAPETDDDGRRQVLDVLEVLTSSYRDRHGSE